MKKKLLSLLMAGAVVAGTSVQAFAQTYTGNAADTIEANVTVSGTIRDAQGNAPAGKIQVEVPTKLSFTIDQNGAFTAGQYAIKNSGSETVQVLLGSFQETDPTGGINLKKFGENLDSVDRSNVKLALKGNVAHVDLADKASADTKISEIKAGASDNIQLLGAAGKQPGGAVDQNGASEDFNLIFKIKKA